MNVSQGDGRLSVVCRALSLALRRQPPGFNPFIPLAEGQPSARAVRPRRQSAPEAEARCVVLAAGAHHAGGVDPSTPRCKVGAEDGWVYRVWHWLSVAWPVNVILYLLTLPVAEVLWWFASRHYVRVRSATPHVVQLGAADAAIALRLYRRAAHERSPAELAMMLLRWFHGDWPSRSQVRAASHTQSHSWRKRSIPRVHEEMSTHTELSLAQARRPFHANTPVSSGL